MTYKTESSAAAGQQKGTFTGPRPDSQRGITLIEMIVAVTMLAVLLGAGFPSFTAVLKDNRLDAEASRFVANLNFARSEASSRATVVTMSRKSLGASNWTAGWEIYTDEDAGGNSSRVIADTLLRDADEATTDVTVYTNDSGNAWISFRPNGMLNEGGDEVVIAICDDRGKEFGMDLNINRAGRVSLTQPSLDCTPA